MIAVYWTLWAIDGLKLAPRRTFALIRGPRRFFARLHYRRWLPPSFSPFGWRIITSDIPLSLSPEGVTNLMSGSAGRPAERPVSVRAWRWEELDQVGVAKGWLYLNGQRFCPDTGHLRAPDLLALARLPPDHRAARIRRLVRSWFRPGHLQRRARVLAGRTRAAAFLNAVALAGTCLLSIYVAGNVADYLGEARAAAIAGVLPWTLLALLILHFAGIMLGWRALHRLRSADPSDRRGGALFSALLLPPQALKIRLLAADGYFPAQHPLAAALAFARQSDRQELGFNALADLRWPLASADTPAAAGAITAWFSAELEPQLQATLHLMGLTPATLLQAPEPDGPTSCLYCPRCRDQFTAGRSHCPHGIALQPTLPNSSHRNDRGGEAASCRFPSSKRRDAAST